MIQWLNYPTQGAKAGLRGYSSSGWLNFPAENPCIYGHSAGMVVAARFPHLAPTLADDPALLKVMIRALLADNAKTQATLRAKGQMIQTLRQHVAKRLQVDQVLYTSRASHSA